MTLLAGSVSVAANGSVTKSGAAGRLYDQFAARAGDNIPGGLPSGSAGYKIKKSIAQQAEDIATWMVAEMTSHAIVVIPIGVIVSAETGVTATGPAAPVNLSIT